MKTREWTNGRWNTEQLANGTWYAQAWAAATDSGPVIVAEGRGETEQAARADLYTALAQWMKIRGGETVTNDQGWLLPSCGESEREYKAK